MAGSEAIDAIKMGLILIFLAAVLFFVVRNINIGEELTTKAAYSAENTTKQVLEGTFNELTYQSKVMPASAVYALIGENASDIDGITDYIYDPTGGPDSYAESINESHFKEHMSGLVRVWAEPKDPSTEQYHLYISSDIVEMVKVTTIKDGYPEENDKAERCAPPELSNKEGFKEVFEKGEAIRVDSKGTPIKDSEVNPIKMTAAEIRTLINSNKKLINMDRSKCDFDDDHNYDIESNRKNLDCILNFRNHPFEDTEENHENKELSVTVTFKDGKYEITVHP